MKLTKAFFEEIKVLIASARATVARGVDLVQVYTNFQIGRRIVEQEQKGKGRAAYGQEVIKALAERLTGEFGRGYSKRSLELMRQFYVFNAHRLPIAQTLSAQLPKAKKTQTLSAQSVVALIFQTPSGKSQMPTEKSDDFPISQSTTGQSDPRPFTLSWSHYVFLLSIKNPDERSFYEIEVANESWTVRELKRQFDSSLYERLALSRYKAGIRKLAQKGQIVESIADVLKEPLVLEFLGLEDQPRFSENDLETAIIKNVSTFRPNGASQASPGQRPGKAPHPTSKALQGRPNRCPNPWPAFTSISSSAPRTANPSSPIPSAARCTPTWPWSCKTSTALPSSSIPSKTTLTCFSISPGPSPSAKSSRMLKNLPQNGLKPKARNSSRSHGNPDTEPSPFPNPMWKPSANTLPTNANTIERKRSRKNTGHFSNGTTSRSMNDTCGIDPVGSANGAAQIFSTNGAALRQPGATPWEQRPQINRGPTARSKRRATVRSGLQPLNICECLVLGPCPRLASGRALPLKKGGQR